MKQLSIQEQFEWFEAAARRIDIDPVTKSDEDLEYEIFEEFDIEAVTFFHSDVLDRLLQAGYIDEHIKRSILKIRELFLKLQESDKWDVRCIRTASEWKEIFALARELNKSLNSSP